MNAAVITARGGSKSLPEKNVMQMAGRPLVAYPLTAALAARRVGVVYVTTDSPAIAAMAREAGCLVVDRPESLAGDDVNHGDVIKHAVEEIDRREVGLENVVVLLGNTVMVDGEIIDEALVRLEAEPDIDSVMTVWEAVDDHPLRALELKDGLLRPYGGSDREVSTERQSYETAYYYDQGVWAFRKECVQERCGPNPWWWMGRRCVPIVRPWVAGRDIHNNLDAAVAEWWLTEREIIGRATARPEKEK